MSNEKIIDSHFEQNTADEEKIDKMPFTTCGFCLPLMKEYDCYARNNDRSGSRECRDDHEQHEQHEQRNSYKTDRDEFLVHQLQGKTQKQKSKSKLFFDNAFRMVQNNGMCSNIFYEFTKTGKKKSSAKSKIRAKSKTRIELSKIPSVIVLEEKFTVKSMEEDYSLSSISKEKIKRKIDDLTSMLERELNTGTTGSESLESSSTNQFDQILEDRTSFFSDDSDVSSISCPIFAHTIANTSHNDPLEILSLLSLAKEDMSDNEEESEKNKYIDGKQIFGSLSESECGDFCQQWLESDNRHIQHNMIKAKESFLSYDDIASNTFDDIFDGISYDDEGPITSLLSGIKFKSTDEKPNLNELCEDSLQSGSVTSSTSEGSSELLSNFFREAAQELSE